MAINKTRLLALAISLVFFQMNEATARRSPVLDTARPAEVSEAKKNREKSFEQPPKTSEDSQRLVEDGYSEVRALLKQAGLQAADGGSVLIKQALGSRNKEYEKLKSDAEKIDEVEMTSEKVNESFKETVALLGKLAKEAQEGVDTAVKTDGAVREVYHLVVKRMEALNSRSHSQERAELGRVLAFVVHFEGIAREALMARNGNMLDLPLKILEDIKLELQRNSDKPFTAAFEKNGFAEKEAQWNCG